jgi:hypothetical protein
MAGAIARSQEAAFKKQVDDFIAANPQRAKQMAREYARQTGQPLES